jgi:hypothetical protein
MRFRAAIVLAGAFLASLATNGMAQRTGDRARLVFTVSGALVDGRGIWAVERQPIGAGTAPDALTITRGFKTNFGVGFSGAYYPGENLGFTGDAFLLGLGFDDTCRPASPIANPRNAEVCDYIDRTDRPGSAVTLGAGVIYRVASREFISPFARLNAGLLISNQSHLALDGVANNGEGVSIYMDDRGTRVTPSLALGIGTTVVLGRAYHLRWEIRDNVIRVDQVTAPAEFNGAIPPHDGAWKHLLSVLVGLDIILERQRGRRY